MEPRAHITSTYEIVPGYSQIPYHTKANLGGKNPHRNNPEVLETLPTITKRRKPNAIKKQTK